VKTSLTTGELLGFGAFVAAFVVAFWAMGLDGQSWGAVALLGVFLVGLVAYRTWLKRRRS
jgi:branched-subunit amino acid ABC-type transport system permease component